MTLMAHPTASPHGPRREIGPELTETQRELIERARQAGYSKQAVVTQGIALVQKSDLDENEPYGAGRKMVKFRMGPEVLAQLQQRCAEWDATQAQVIAACAKVLTR